MQKLGSHANIERNRELSRAEHSGRFNNNGDRESLSCVLADFRGIMNSGSGVQGVCRTSIGASAAGALALAHMVRIP